MEPRLAMYTLRKYFLLGKNVIFTTFSVDSSEIFFVEVVDTDESPLEMLCHVHRRRKYSTPNIASKYFMICSSFYLQNYIYFINITCYIYLIFNVFCRSGLRLRKKHKLSCNPLIIGSIFPTG